VPAPPDPDGRYAHHRDEPGMLPCLYVPAGVVHQLDAAPLSGRTAFRYRDSASTAVIDYLRCWPREQPLPTNAPYKRAKSAGYDHTPAAYPAHGSLAPLGWFDEASREAELSYASNPHFRMQPRWITAFPRRAAAGTCRGVSQASLPEVTRRSGRSKTFKIFWLPLHSSPKGVTGPTSAGPDVKSAYRWRAAAIDQGGASASVPDANHPHACCR